jgi:hypothetical protein
MKRIVIACLVSVAAAASAACFEFKTSTSPTNVSTSTSQAIGGTWAGVQSLPGSSGSLQDSCVNFKWSVTQFSGTSGSGSFSATCMGNIDVAGTASATLAGSTLTWQASASGTIQGQTVCSIALSGTATLEANNQIRIPYSGTTCLGPVSGTEIIKR